MKISSYFNISSHVDFVDVDTRGDTRCFLQAPRIRWLASKGNFWALDAAKDLDDFTITVFDLVLEERKPACLKLFSALGEVPELRLGYASDSRMGNGSGEKLSEELYKALASEPTFLVPYGGYAHVEEAMTFIPQMGVDRVSDMVGRIVMRTLIAFTQHEMTIHPELRVGARPADFVVWDTGAFEWTRQRAVVPHVGGTPVILVPSSWTDTTLQFSLSRIIGQGICRPLQEERAYADSSGKVVKPTITELREEVSTEPREVIRRIRRQAVSENPIDGLALTRRYLDEWFDSQEAA